MSHLTPSVLRPQTNKQTNKNQLTQNDHSVPCCVCAPMG